MCSFFLNFLIIAQKVSISKFYESISKSVLKIFFDRRTFSKYPKTKKSKVEIFKIKSSKNKGIKFFIKYKI